jgi:hypothetical protein
MGLLTRAPARARSRGGVARGLLLFASIFMAAACAPAEPPKLATASGESLEFEGSWNGVGTRHSIPLGEGRIGSIVDLQGSLLLSGADRPGVGFHSEVIGLTDSASGFQGRSVWTDERGDQVFSELQGEGTAAQNHITGTILSGTGRYAGATGSYDFSWQWVLEGEDGAVQGRAVDLKGRVKPGPAAGEPGR